MYSLQRNTEHYSAQIILLKILTVPNKNVNGNIVSAVRMAVSVHMSTGTPRNIYVSRLQTRGVTVVGRTFNRHRRSTHFRLHTMT